MDLTRKSITVCGAGGFIGGHLVKNLLTSGAGHVRAVDIKPLCKWQQTSSDAENLTLDLSDKLSCLRAVEGSSIVYQLAADMGGIGFIENNKALCMLNVLINTHMLLAARDCGAKRFFYSSSACVYSQQKQMFADVVPLREEDAYPASPEDGYGWEKLFSERMCRHFEEDFGLQCRVARYHNVYGPQGTWYGGREKAPAAICRKVIEAKYSGRKEIEIWGDGTQTRSFLYIDDCLKGTRAILESDIHEAINLGSDELVTINDLVSMAEGIAGVRLKRVYVEQAPKGVNGRNSDNTRLFDYLQWKPTISLRDGLERTYAWIENEMGVAPAVAHSGGSLGIETMFDQAALGPVSPSSTHTPDVSKGCGPHCLSPWTRSRSKRIFDVAFVLALSPIALPLSLLIAAAIRLTSNGSALFFQRRVGQHGRRFFIVKFRTMLWSPRHDRFTITTHNQQDITAVGRFLRWSKLDELPQFINVLRGDMSLVGPRPKVPEQEIGCIECRPGLTGAATLAFAREECLFSCIPAHRLDHYYRNVVLPLKYQMDAEYMAQATLASDLKLIFRTFLRRWDESFTQRFTDRVFDESSSSLNSLGVHGPLLDVEGD